jgi:hypothetical protein
VRLAAAELLSWVSLEDAAATWPPGSAQPAQGRFTRNELTLSLNPRPTRQPLLAVCVVAVPVKLNSW